MSGESPLNMMRSAPPRPRRRGAPRRRWLWPFFATLAAVIVLAVVWSWLWYYAASIADRALAGWIDREAALGRVYACETQSIGGFPFSIVTRCGPAAVLRRQLVAGAAKPARPAARAGACDRDAAPAAA